MEILNQETDHEACNTLLRAFNLASNYLDEHRIEFSVPVETASEFLKLIIVAVAESGERNPLRIADLAIARMRKLVKASDPS
jgi:hypothetical protein